MQDALDNLSRAGIATHVVERCEGSDVLEADLLSALLGIVPGSVFRIAAHVYAFDARAATAAGLEEGASPAETAGAIGRAMQALLGEATVTVRALEQTAEQTEEKPQVSQDAVVLLRALTEAAGLAPAREDPGLRAVIDAEFAVKAARLTAQGLATIAVDGSVAEALQARLERIEQALSEVDVRLGALAEPASTGADALAGRLQAIEDRFGDLAERLDRLTSVASAGNPDQVASYNRFSIALQGVLRRFDMQISAVEQVAGRFEMLAGETEGVMQARLGTVSETILGLRADISATLGAVTERLDTLAQQLPEPERDESGKVAVMLAETLARVQMYQDFRSE